MAVYNEILAGRYNRLLQKLFSMKGGPPAPSLAGDVVSSLVFFNGVENRYLEQWIRFGNAIEGGVPGVGNLNRVRFRNPVGSNVVAVVEKWTMSTTTADIFRMSISQQTADLAGLATKTGNNLDRRAGLGTSSTCILSSEQSATVLPGAEIGAWQMPANIPVDMVATENQELTLLPGDAYSVQSVTTAVGTMNIVLWWRERLLEESERT